MSPWPKAWLYFMLGPKAHDHRLHHLAKAVSTVHTQPPHRSLVQSNRAKSKNQGRFPSRVLSPPRALRPPGSTSVSGQSATGKQGPGQVSRRDEWEGFRTVSGEGGTEPGAQGGRCFPPVTPCCPHFETRRAGRSITGAFVPGGLGSSTCGLTWRRPPSR